MGDSEQKQLKSGSRPWHKHKAAFVSQAQALKAAHPNMRLVLICQSPYSRDIALCTCIHDGSGLDAFTTTSSHTTQHMHAHVPPGALSPAALSRGAWYAACPHADRPRRTYCCERRVVAATAGAGAGAGCPRAAGYFVVTLLGIKTPADFTEPIKEAFKQAIQRLAPGAGWAAAAAAQVGYLRQWLRAALLSPLATLNHSHAAAHQRCPCIRPAGATIHPIALEDEDRAQAVHTVVTFPAPFAAGLAAARQLEAKLLGSVPQFFDKRTFGNVHMETVSAPYLVGGARCAGGSCWGRAPAGISVGGAQGPAWHATASCLPACLPA